MLPTAVGTVAKYMPFEAPLMTAKKANGTKVVEAGHSASMLTALRINETMSVFRGPRLSEQKPPRMRPMADEKL